MQIFGTKIVGQVFYSLFRAAFRVDDVRADRIVDFPDGFRDCKFGQDL